MYKDYFVHRSIENSELKVQLLCADKKWSKTWCVGMAGGAWRKTAFSAKGIFSGAVKLLLNIALEILDAWDGLQWKNRMF